MLCFFPSYFKLVDRKSCNPLRIVLTAVAGSALGHLADLAHVAIPKTNEHVFYSLEFLLNLAFPFTIIALLPYAVASVTNGKPKTL